MPRARGEMDHQRKGSGVCVCVCASHRNSSCYYKGGVSVCFGVSSDMCEF